MADMRTIPTSRFGDLEIAEERVLTMISPILGFEDITEFVLLEHADESPFHWLQAIGMPELAFVVTNPQLFGIGYEFELPDEATGSLNLTRAEDALVFTIVNIPGENPKAMTANLLGPIVINKANQQAAQVILSDTEFSTKTPLLKESDESEQADNVTPLHTNS